MINRPSILSITGSDSTGGAGVQADIRTITAMGANALAVVTSVTVKDGDGVMTIYNLPEEQVVGQVQNAIEYIHPHTVKVGMLRDADTIVSLSKEIVAMKNIVLAPGIMSSRGERLLTDEALRMWEHHLLPMAKMVVMRCDEAEVLLGMKISTDDDMVKAASMLTRRGADSVMLRGGLYVKNMLKALLYYKGRSTFYSTYNMEGWQRHGVSGAMSTAIATRLAMGDDIATAVSEAHKYMHSQVVYSVTPEQNMTTASGYRPADIYNNFLTLIAGNYRTSHDVNFYADKMAITTRYLYNVTLKVVRKSPKVVIAEYIVQEAKKLLETSRLSIQEISDMLGFSSQTMFSRFFSTYAGSSPSNYRKNLA